MALLIHAEDVAQSFPAHWTHIELELDHLRILCPLFESFHRGQPEIRDARLSCWLRAKHGAGKLDAADGWLVMLPVYEGVFRLVPAENVPADRVRAEDAALQIITTAMLSSVPDTAEANVITNLEPVLLARPPRPAPSPRPATTRKNNFVARAS